MAWINDVALSLYSEDGKHSLLDQLIVEEILEMKFKIITGGAYSWKNEESTQTGTSALIQDQTATTNLGNFGSRSGGAFTLQYKFICNVVAAGQKKV